jgi:isoprenylcysteine carboxyl methyltransferase (ICMT) family protein YpbQ
MKNVLEFLAELIVMVACLVCIGCAVCVMNGNNNAKWLGLISLAVVVIAVVIDERRKK